MDIYSSSVYRTLEPILILWLLKKVPRNIRYLVPMKSNHLFQHLSPRTIGGAEHPVPLGSFTKRLDCLKKWVENVRFILILTTLRPAAGSVPAWSRIVNWGGIPKYKWMSGGSHGTDPFTIKYYCWNAADADWNVKIRLLSWLHFKHSWTAHWFVKHWSNYPESGK